MDGVTQTAINCIETIVKALVDPERQSDVEITSQVGERMITVSIATHKEDIGRIIGKNGRTISAIRTIIQSVVANGNKRINIVVLD